MRDEILGLLAADAALSAILTGGVYTATEITRQNTPGAYDENSELKPCALLRLETQSPHGPHANSARQFLAFYVYQRAGFSQIDAAAARIYDLLEKASLAAQGVYEITHVDDSPDVFDEGVSANLRICRYQAIRLR